MIKLEQFKESDFDTLISWIDNKDLLVQIAGNVFSFPLTREQLRRYLRDEKSKAFNIVDTDLNTVIGHAEIYHLDQHTCKLDKLIIGDKSSRGKGHCQQVMKTLLDLSFAMADMKTVELNVYDWNTAAKRCYEKVGFMVNPEKNFLTRVNGNEWLALNMVIERDKWLDAKTIEKSGGEFLAKDS
jgi:RimJ/RimL family protein N-acetyltransferase